MFGKIAVLRAVGGARSRWLSAGVAIVSCTALAVLAVGGDALASNAVAPATTTGKIKACYLKGGQPHPLKHVPLSAKCPTGYVGLVWNKVGPTGPAGPQGPAGVSAGVSGFSNTQVILTSFQPVIVTTPVTTAGTYYLSASAEVWVDTGDVVSCSLGNQDSIVGIYSAAGPASGAEWQTLPLSAPMNLSAGDTVDVWCGDINGDSNTYFSQGAVTGTLITNPASAPAHLEPVRDASPQRAARHHA